MTREEKIKQIRKEAKATSILFAICVIWHVGFGYGLSGVDVKVFGLPLWWVLSTPGVFVVGVVGVLFLLNKVFRNFSLEDDDIDGGSGIDAAKVSGTFAEAAAASDGDSASNEEGGEK